LPGIYGNKIAFVAELVISFILMSAILFTSNDKILAFYTHYFAAILVAVYIAATKERTQRRAGSTGTPPPHKSMTTSPAGCEQQTRTLPSAGLSSGSGS
jgi:hypothetical protein